MSPCPVRVSVNIKQISFMSGCFSLSLCVHVCMRLWLSHSLDCVLPVTPVSLIQLLHVQSELAQAEILNSVFVVRSAAQRWHTLRRCWEKGEGRKGKDGVRIMKESGLNVSWIAAQCIIQCRANNFFQLLKSVMQRALAAAGWRQRAKLKRVSVTAATFCGSMQTDPFPHLLKMTVCWHSVSFITAVQDLQNHKQTDERQTRQTERQRFR